MMPKKKERFYTKFINLDNASKMKVPDPRVFRRLFGLFFFTYFFGLLAVSLPVFGAFHFKDGSFIIVFMVYFMCFFIMILCTIDFIELHRTYRLFKKHFLPYLFLFILYFLVIGMIVIKCLFAYVIEPMGDILYFNFPLFFLGFLPILIVYFVLADTMFLSFFVEYWLKRDKELIKIE